MKQEGGRHLNLGDLNTSFLAHPDLLIVRNAFCTVMEQTRHLSLLQIRSVAHRQRGGGEHDAKRMLKPVRIKFFFYFFLKLDQIIVAHRSPSQEYSLKQDQKRNSGYSFPQQATTGYCERRYQDSDFPASGYLRDTSLSF